MQLPLALTGDAGAGLGRPLQQRQSRDLILSSQKRRAPEHMGMHKCTARSGTTALRKETSEEAVLYRLEMQRCWETDKEDDQIAGSFQGVSCLLWYIEGVP